MWLTLWYYCLDYTTEILKFHLDIWILRQFEMTQDRVDNKNLRSFFQAYNVNFPTGKLYFVYNITF